MSDQLSRVEGTKGATRPAHLHLDHLVLQSVHTLALLLCENREAALYPYCIENEVRFKSVPTSSTLVSLAEKRDRIGLRSGVAEVGASVNRYNKMNNSS